MTLKSIEMARIITKASTANCTLPHYIGFIISEPKQISCESLAEIMDISHDSVNRFLNREDYTAEDLFKESTRNMCLKGGTVSVDDTVLDKPYAKVVSFVGYRYSGKHHRVVKGIGLITLYYTDINGQKNPINYRIYDDADGKTKNDYFIDMLEEVKLWGLEPSFITGDSWYGSLKNLKYIKNDNKSFLFGIKSNRLVSISKEEGLKQVRDIDIPEEGKDVYLNHFGYVRVFSKSLKDQTHYYAVYISSDDGSPKKNEITREEAMAIHDSHWGIEQYHRVIKQVCKIEKFYVRNEKAVKTHIFAGICGYVTLLKMKTEHWIENVYRLSRDLFGEVVYNFIMDLAPSLEHLNPKVKKVNA